MLRASHGRTFNADGDGDGHGKCPNVRNMREREMGKDEVQLFAMWPAPMSLRIEWALKLKQIEYEYIEEDHYNKSPLLLKYNPIYKKVPVLVHDGKAMVESLVILDYIDETWNVDWKLLPHDPYERAKARFWARFADDKCFPSIVGIWSKTGDLQEKALKEAQENLKTLEQALNGNKFFGGEKIGYLDIVIGWISYWVPLIEVAFGLNIVDENTMPLFHAWFKDFLDFPVVKERLPPKEKLLAHVKNVREEVIASSSKS